MNIIIYVTDALRADHLGCYGYERETSPNIDQVAEEGILFEQAYSISTWTKPVAASILTGCYPLVHGVRTREDSFFSSIKRLPEFLKCKDYTVAGFSAMGNVSSAFGFAKGFDEYFDLYKEKDLIGKRSLTTSREEEFHEEGKKQVALPLAEDLNDYFSSWLETFSGGNFLAFLWAIDTHIPYQPPENCRKFTDPNYAGKVDGSRESLKYVKTQEDLEHLIDLYDSEIYYLDHQLGILMDKLKELDIWDETLFIFTGDHGDAFREHGRLTHGHIPYQELIKVPLIIKMPQSHHVEKKVEAPVSLIDIVPTILDLALQKSDNAKYGHIQGNSLVPLINNEKDRGERRYFFSETKTRDFQTSFRSVVADEWKYISIEKPKRDTQSIKSLLSYLLRHGVLKEILLHPIYFFKRYFYRGNEMLFNLNEDPRETNNLRGEYPDVKQRLKKRLQEWQEECEEASAKVKEQRKAEIDEQTTQQLRDLGYLD